MAILKLIEDVDPEDRDALDEIDARVDCFRMKCRFISFTSEMEFPCEYSFQGHVARMQSSRYTRSRDDLKAIRPEGWAICVTTYKHKAIANCLINMEGKLLQANRLPTEELAELHAIIQAIQWERDNGQSKNT